MIAVVVTAAAGAAYLLVRHVQVERQPRQPRRQMIRKMSRILFRSREAREVMDKMGAF